MKITHLSMSAFKGISTTVPEQIAPVTVFTGDNETGKTARLKAIMIGLLGHDPELGVQPGSTALHGGKNGLSVGLTFDNGTTNQRAYLRKGAKVTLNETAAITVPVVMLNAASYFDLGAKDRMRTVFALGGASPEDLLAKCKDRVSKIQMVPHGEVESSHLRSLSAFIDTTWTASVDKPGNEKLPIVIRALRDKINLLRASKDAKSALSAERSQADNITTNPTPEIKEVDATILRLQGSISQLKAKREAWEASVRKRTELESLIAGFTPANDEELAALRNERDELQATVEGFTSVSHAEAAALKAAKADVTRIRSEWGLAQVKLDSAKAETCPESCPTCGSSSDGWATRKAEHAAGLVTKLAMLQADCERIHAAYTDAGQLVAKHTEALQRETTRDEEHRIRLARLNKVRGELQSIEQKASSVAQAKSTLESIQAAEFSEQDINDLESFTNQMVEANARKVAVMAKLQAWNRYQSDRAASAKLIEECEGLDAEIKVVKEVVATVEAVQESEVECIFKNLMAHANRFADGILRAPIEFRSGEVGIQIGDQFVSDTLCGKERQIVQLAMSAALAATSKFKLLMVDEFSVFSAETQRVLLERIVSLVNEGVIDQFIAGGTSCVPVDGVKIIECRRPE